MMKWTYNFAALMMLLLTWNSLSAQQQSKDFTIPLSKPGQPGKLQVDLHDGGVTVEGYSGKDVIVAVTTYDSEQEDKSSSREGLKRIPNTSVDFEIVENDNVVSITGSHRGRTDFKVKVPQQFSLSLGTHHNGDVKVTNVSGEIEVDAHHGGMELQNVSGSVVADTHHGSIVITFGSVKAGTPMAFSTYHGDVDITFPANINATAKMKSEKGEIFTDFDMKTKTPAAKLEDSGDGVRQIIVNSWIYSELGSGGPEFMFTTHHGDIILRKKK